MAQLRLVEPEHMLFQYDCIDTEVAVSAKQAAERIKLRLRRSAEDIIEIGRDLISVKESLPHGQFLPWIEAEFGMSLAAATRFMNVGRVYGGKIVTVTNLPPTALYELAAPKTPLEVREEIEKMIAAGEVVTKATVQALREKLAGLEKSNEWAESEIAEQSAKVANLEGDISVRLSQEVAKAEQRISRGYEDEIARLKRAIVEATKSRPGTTVIDHESGNVVAFHKPLGEEEKADIDAEHDEYTDGNFNEIATEDDRVLAVFGCIRSIATISVNPNAVHSYIMDDCTAEENIELFQTAFNLMKAIEEIGSND